MTLISVSPGDVIRSTPDINQYKDHLEGAVGNELAWFLRVLAANNFIIRLPDAAGAQSFIIQDSAGVAVFEVDSNGVQTPSFTSGLTRVGGITTEQTTTSTVAVDFATISGLSIPAGTRVRVIGKARKTAGAVVNAGLGLKINSTIVREAAPTVNSTTAIWAASATDQAEDGDFSFEFDVGETNYRNSIDGIYLAKRSSDGQLGTSLPDKTVPTFLTNSLPAATVTDIIIRGLVTNAAVTLAVKDIHVFTYANS